MFITFEGTEGCGKSTQIKLLAERLRALGHRVRTLREPGGTPIGEEIRHTLKHSQHNHAMTAEAELLLMNASRAQLVREVIRPALAAGEIVLCDRFYDSTTAYQGYGRELDLEKVKAVIEFAVGETKPNLDVVPARPGGGQRRSGCARARPLCRSSATVSRRRTGNFSSAWRTATSVIAAGEPQRVKFINGAQPVEAVCAEIWECVQPRLPKRRPLVILFAGFKQRVSFIRT